MDADQPQPGDVPDRRETATERLDRNWSNLLQELRVVQTGVQLLTGFLLTLPFSYRFDRLDTSMRVVYLATVVCSMVSTMLLASPVSIHRLLFRRHRLASLVSAAHRYTLVGMAFLGAALTGVAIVIFDTVVGLRAAIAAGTAAAAVLLFFWVALPLWMRRHDGAARPRL